MATLKDVALKAGITVTTVSRVLNNRGYISETTREKVFKAMEELNYSPNEVARALSQKHTNCIGVIVPSVMHPFFCEVVNYLEYYAFEKGYKVMLCNSYHQREKEAEYINMLRSNKVSGIVLCSRTENMEQLLKVGMPVVTFERVISQDISAVSCDNLQGGELATRHLIEQGCRRLLHIGGAVGVHLPADDRRLGFERICAQYGIECRTVFTKEEQFQQSDYETFLEQALEAYPGVDGVFASSDVIAAELIRVCSRKGIRVPEDLKIVGFDDIRLASLTTPSITTIRQPVAEMCQYAVDVIARQLEKTSPPVRATLAVSLMRRESSGAVEIGYD